MKFLSAITVSFPGHVSVVRQGQSLLTASVQEVPMAVKLYDPEEITLG